MYTNMHLHAANSHSGSTIRSLLVDLDGTIFNTVEANVAAYKEAFKHSDIKFDENLYRKGFGLGFKELIQVMAPGLAQVVQDRIQQNKKKFYPQFFSIVVPNHTLLAFLEMQKKSCKIVLVSTASKENGEAILTHFKKTSIFDKCFFREDIEKSKPAPDGYLKAMEWLEMGPAECLAFEDSSHGIEAAKSAGIQVISIV